MKRLSVMLALILVPLLAGCGDDENPMAPTDPLLDMYGTYTGTLSMTFETGLTQDSMVLVLGSENEVSVTLSGVALRNASGLNSS